MGVGFVCHNTFNIPSCQTYNKMTLIVFILYINKNFYSFLYGLISEIDINVSLVILSVADWLFMTFVQIFISEERPDVPDFFVVVGNVLIVCNVVRLF
jgi:hypothetical protein